MKNLDKSSIDFLNKLSKVHGNREGDYFDYSTFVYILEHNIESPIERIFLIALKFAQNVLCIPEDNIITISEVNYITGLHIKPQQKVGNFRCDFLISYSRFKKDDYSKDNYIERNIIVECDSQEFHERTEKQRRYEKERDRFFLKKDYKVFHYTGKEIIDNPLKIANEVLCYLSDKEQNEKNEYENIIYAVEEFN